MKDEIKKLMESKPREFIASFKNLLEEKKKAIIENEKIKSVQGFLKEETLQEFVSVENSLEDGVKGKKSSINITFKNGRKTEVDATDAKIILSAIDKMSGSIKQRYVDALNKNPASFMIALNKIMKEEYIKEKE